MPPPPQYFYNYKELVKRGVLCPPNTDSLTVRPPPPPPPQSQSCSAVSELTVLWQRWKSHCYYIDARISVKNYSNIAVISLSTHFAVPLLRAYQSHVTALSVAMAVAVLLFSLMCLSYYILLQAYRKAGAGLGEGSITLDNTRPLSWTILESICQKVWTNVVWSTHAPPFRPLFQNFWIDLWKFLRRGFESPIRASLVFVSHDSLPPWGVPSKMTKRICAAR